MEILNNLQLVGFYLFIGILSSSLLFLLSYVIIMRISTLTIFSLLEDSSKLLFIYLILIIIIIGTSLLITILISSILEKKLYLSLVIPSTIFSLLFTLVTIGILSYLLLFIYYPNFFIGVEGIELFFIYPTVLVNFSNFVLNHPFAVIILLIVLYYVLFLLFLEFFS